jgi:hypothetical protein
MSDDDAYESGTYLDHLDEAQTYVAVQPGWSDGKVVLKAPGIDELELSPHEIDEWLEQHGFRPAQHQRTELDTLVEAAIERGRRRAAGEPDGPVHDSGLSDLWEEFARSVQALQQATGSDDRNVILQATSAALGVMSRIEERSGGGQSWDAELEAWGRHLWTSTTWTLESVQHAGSALGQYGDSVAGWALIQSDKRNAEVITAQHQFHDYAGQVRQGLAPVETWATP